MNIAIYSRKSIHSEKGESTQNQIYMCKDYIDRKYVDIQKNIFIFEDDGFSGKNIKREKFIKMLGCIENGNIDILICYKLDRVTRNVLDFANLIELLERKNVSFVCIKEEFDTSKPMGKAMLYMASIFAQLERETIAERVKDNMYILAEKGYWLGGTLPTGYKSKEIKENGKIKHILCLDKIEAYNVKLIYDKMIELKSISKVKYFLETNLILSKNGNKFSINSIREILTNPVYCIGDKSAYLYFKGIDAKVCFEIEKCSNKKGIIAYSRRNYVQGRQIKSSNNNWIIALGEHMGVIKGSDWGFVQKFFKNKKEHRPHNDTALFSGKIFCKNCENKMIFKAHSNIENNGIFYYICNTKIQKGAVFCNCKNIKGNDFDKKIFGRILLEVKDEYLYNKIPNKIYNIEDKIKKADKNLQKLKIELNRALEMLLEGDTNEILKESITTKIEFITENIKKIEIEKADLKNNDETEIRELSTYEKRNLIEKLTEKIYWNNDKIEILYKNVAFLNR